MKKQAKENINTGPRPKLTVEQLKTNVEKEHHQPIIAEEKMTKLADSNEIKRNLLKYPKKAMKPEEKKKAEVKQPFLKQKQQIAKKIQKAVENNLNKKQNFISSDKQPMKIVQNMTVEKKLQENPIHQEKPKLNQYIMNKPQMIKQNKKIEKYFDKNKKLELKQELKQEIYEKQLKHKNQIHQNVKDVKSPKVDKYKKIQQKPKIETAKDTKLQKIKHEAQNNYKQVQKQLMSLGIQDGKKVLHHHIQVQEKATATKLSQNIMHSPCQKIVKERVAKINRHSDELAMKQNLKFQNAPKTQDDTQKKSYEDSKTQKEQDKLATQMKENQKLIQKHFPKDPNYKVQTKHIQIKQKEHQKGHHVPQNKMKQQKIQQNKNKPEAKNYKKDVHVDHEKHKAIESSHLKRQEAKVHLQTIHDLKKGKTQQKEKQQCKISLKGHTHANQNKNQERSEVKLQNSPINIKIPEQKQDINKVESQQCQKQFHTLSQKIPLKIAQINKQEPKKLAKKQTQIHKVKPKKVVGKIAQKKEIKKINQNESKKIENKQVQKQANPENIAQQISKPSKLQYKHENVLKKPEIKTEKTQGHKRQNAGLPLSELHIKKN